MSITLEESGITSIQKRIRAYVEVRKSDKAKQQGSTV
jgi:hypothetical protein